MFPLAEMLALATMHLCAFHFVETHVQIANNRYCILFTSFLTRYVFKSFIGDTF